MTAPTFANLTTLVTGSVFATGRNVTGLIEAAGAVEGEHFSVCHRFFATARWSLDELGLAVLGRLAPWLGEEPVMLALDDTLARKHGLKQYGAGMNHDPLLSSRRQAAMNYGHCWRVLGVLVCFPYRPRRVFCLPIVFALYLNRKSAAKHRRVYRAKPELAVELLQRLARRMATLRRVSSAAGVSGPPAVAGGLGKAMGIHSETLAKAARKCESRTPDIRPSPPTFG